MQREYTTHPLLGVAVTIWHADKVLLIQRGKQPNYGTWNIPGGLVELGETLAAAAQREIMEECGVEIATPELLTTVDIIERDADGAVRYHYIIIEMVARWQAGVAQAGDDALAASWFSRDELDTLDLLPQTRAVVLQAYQQHVRTRD